MNWKIPMLGAVLCTAIILTAPLAALAPKKPLIAATCLPPGAKSPVACATARAGQTIRLRIATTSLPTEPMTLSFTELEPVAGRAPRAASLTVPATRSEDGGYDITVPRQLCAAGQAEGGNFEIQRLMSSYNQSESSRSSLGTITVAC